MKFIKRLFFLLVLCLFYSCESGDIYKDFEVDYAYTFQIPASSMISLPLDLFGGERESNEETQFEINDTRKDLLEEVFLKSFHIEILSPQGENFDFLKSVSFYLDAASLPEILVAEKDPVPDNVFNEINFSVGGENLADYLKADAFDIRANMVTDEERTQEIEVRAFATFDVRAKVIDF